MRVHVVFAHPAEDSYGASLHQRLVETLRKRGDEVADFDLHRMGFDPVMQAGEWRTQNATAQTPDELLPYIEALKWADACVYCFPTWWSGMPAILKGYFDRVWRPEVAFTVPEHGNLIKPALLNIKRMGVVTTCGSPWWYNRGFMQDPARKVLLRGLKTMCAPGTRHLYLAMHAMDSSTPAARERFAGTVERRFARF